MGKIVGQGVSIPLRVGPAIIGGDLNTVGLRGSSHIVSSSHDVKVRSSIDTVSGGEDIVLVNERSTTEPSIVNEKSHLPGPLVLLSLMSSNNSSSAGRSFNTTGGLQVNIGSLLGGGSSLLDFLDSPGQVLCSCWNWLVWACTCSGHVPGQASS